MPEWNRDRDDRGYRREARGDDRGREFAGDFGDFGRCAGEDHGLGADDQSPAQRGLYRPRVENPIRVLTSDEIQLVVDTLERTEDDSLHAYQDALFQLRREVREGEDPALAQWVSFLAAGGPKPGRISFTPKLGRDPAAPGYNWQETEWLF